MSTPAGGRPEDPSGRDEPFELAAEPGDAQPVAEEQPEPVAQPVWWIAVPALVAAAAVYRLLQGDDGGIWPWGDIVMLVVALGLLGFVLRDRRRTRN